MQPGRRWIVGVTAAALSAVICVGLWALARLAMGPARRLPDGSLLRLEAVSYGQHHPFELGTWWQKRLYPVLSPELRARTGWWGAGSGWQTGVHVSREPGTLGIQGTRWALPRGGGWRLEALALDTQGRPFAPGLGRRGRSAPTAEGSHEFWELPVFPRRGSSVRVRVYAQVPRGPWLPAAEFSVANPQAGAYPSWTPDALPVTRRSGNLSMTLTRLSTTSIQTDAAHPLPPGDEMRTRIAYRLTEDGRPARGWEPVAVRISDATGNRWSHRNDHRRGGETAIEFAGTLPPGETARLRVEVARTEGFGAGDLWHVRGLPVPRRDQLLPAAATTRRHGCELELTLAGAGDPYGRGFRQHSPTVAVSVHPPAKGLRVTLLRAMDDRGRVVSTFGPAPLSGGLEYRIYLDGVAPDARRLELMLAIHRARFFEFLVAAPHPALRAPLSPQTTRGEGPAAGRDHRARPGSFLTRAFGRHPLLGHPAPGRPSAEGA